LILQVRKSRHFSFFLFLLLPCLLRLICSSLLSLLLLTTFFLFFFFGRIKEIDNRSNYNNDKKQIPKNKVKEAIHFSVPPYFLSLSVDPWSFFVTFPIESLISVSALMFW